MRLFDKEKDFILRIVNLILLVWVIVTLVVTYDGMINLFIKKPLESYNVYKEKNCNFDDCVNKDDKTCVVPQIGAETDLEKICKGQYLAYKDRREEDNNMRTKQIISSLLSSITVGTTLYLLNKKKVK